MRPLELRVLPSSRQIWGATLTRSTTGGFGVTYDKKCVGYLHASLGDKFRTWGCLNEDQELGKYNLEDGVRAILEAAGLPIQDEEEGA